MIDKLKYKVAREELNAYINIIGDEYTTPGFIYAVYSPTFPSFVKVGKSYNLVSRLKQYNNSNPHSDYRFVAISKLVDNTVESEQLIKSLGTVIQGNEWLDVKDKDIIIRAIEAL